MSYSKLLDSYIAESNLTLEEIAERCKANGVDIHPSYISKLRKGTRPAPSEEISRALAISCGNDPEKLANEGNIEKTPPEVAEVLFYYRKVAEKSRERVSKMIDEGILDSLMDRVPLRGTLVGLSRDELKSIINQSLENFESMSPKMQIALADLILLSITYQQVNNTKGLYTC